MVPGLLPRTMGKGNRLITDVTPGNTLMTRNGSPNVPGMRVISRPDSVVRDTSSRSVGARTMDSYLPQVLLSTRYFTRSRC